MWGCRDVGMYGSGHLILGQPRIIVEACDRFATIKAWHPRWYRGIQTWQAKPM